MFKLRRPKKTQFQALTTVVEEEVPNWNNLEKSAQLFHDSTLDWSSPNSIIEVMEEFADDEDETEEDNLPLALRKRA